MFSSIKAYTMLGVGLAFALLFAHDRRVDHLRGMWHDKYEAVVAEAVTVVLPAIREASGNPKLQWRPGKGDETAVAQQVSLLGQAKQTAEGVMRDQSQRIAELGEENERLAKLGRAERLRAEKAIAQRNTALAKLEQMELTPGERATCEQQLKDAQSALDLVFKEGV